MDELQTYAALAEIFGALTILGGGLFAFVQMREFRRRRRQQIASDLCREFTKPDLARAVNLVRSLPDGITLNELFAMDDEYQDAMQMVGMTFESMGLLVQKRIASFQVVQELTGGLVLMLWKKLEVWIKETRDEQDNPQFGEWVEWLVGQLEERRSDLIPAHIRYKEWEPS